MGRTMGRPPPDELTDAELITELRFWRERLRVAVARKERDYVRSNKEEVDKYEAEASRCGLV